MYWNIEQSVLFRTNGTEQGKLNFKKIKNKEKHFFSVNKNVQQITQKLKIALSIGLNESAVLS